MSNWWALPGAVIAMILYLMGAIWIDGKYGYKGKHREPGLPKMGNRDKRKEERDAKRAQTP